jgi:ABC-2 type transport system permease protein
MRLLGPLLVVAVALGLRLALSRRRRQRRQLATSAAGADVAVDHARRTTGFSDSFTHLFGDVGAIAAREINERVRGRIFKVGTLLILVVIALAIVIPKATSGSTTTRQTVGVVGALSPRARQAIDAAATADNDRARLVPEKSLVAARAGLFSGRLDFAIVDSKEVVLAKPLSAKNATADAVFVRQIAAYLGVLDAYRAAGLSAHQAAVVAQAKPIPIRTVGRSGGGGTKPTSVIGLILLFFMLTQYCTWILIGVMQEKSSRVVEVLLATVRPIQLLGGKILGIGLVALGQAALAVGFALILGRAVGSDLLKGTAPVGLAAELVWLVLGYAFYCWLYAAAGSMAERQDQVQTLALPLSIPILIGYIVSITVVSSGSANPLVTVLAYLPPTAPFCMSALVGLSLVSWWQFVLSVLISLGGTVAMAAFAARVYRRAVLRTGARVRLRELFA